jgi:hypothetical protein
MLKKASTSARKRSRKEYEAANPESECKPRVAHVRAVKPGKDAVVRAGSIFAFLRWCIGRVVLAT